jgi:hypothetical protein
MLILFGLFLKTKAISQDKTNQKYTLGAKTPFDL